MKVSLSSFYPQRASIALFTCWLATTSAKTFPREDNDDPFLPTPIKPPTKVLLVGDSNAKQQGQFLETLCEGTKVYNAGVGGSTAADWAKAPKSIVAPCKSSTWDVVYISVGGNDYNGSGCSMSAETLQANVEAAIVNIVTNIAPGASKYFMTGYCVPANPLEKWPGCDDPSDFAMGLSIDVTPPEGVDFTIIDSHDICGGDFENWSDDRYFNGDGMHLNSRGHCAVFTQPEVMELLQCENKDDEFTCLQDQKLKNDELGREQNCAKAKGFSCMSGDTGVSILVEEQEEVIDVIGGKDDHSHLRLSSESRDNYSTKSYNDDVIVKVKDLQIGDTIRGLDQYQQPATCQVEAVGSFGSGPVYGNYTQGHYIFNPNKSSDLVATHGTHQPVSIQEKYDVLTSCPLGIDESGTAFTALDTDFCGGFTEQMSWSDYIHLHTAILRVVRGSGGYWFHGASYTDLGFVKSHAPILCEAMLRCVKDHDDCVNFEDASVAFVRRALSDEAREKSIQVFHNIGDHREHGSVSAVVSAGKSVRTK